MSPLEVRFTLEFYADASGERPVVAFLREEARSNPTLAARTQAALKKLGDRRYHGEPLTKELSDGIFELRILGNNSARVLFFFDPNRTIVLVHAFKKKTQSVPSSEMNLAKARMKRYQDRKLDGAGDEK